MSSFQAPTNFGFLPDFRGGFSADVVYIDGVAVNASGGVGGSDTQVQYNNAGSFAGSSDLVFEKGSGTLKATQIEPVDGTAAWDIQNGNTGGNMQIEGGASTVGDAGSITAMAGNNIAAINSGGALVVGGAGLATGGSIEMDAGAAAGASDTGGGFVIRSGAAATVDSGDVTLTASVVTGGSGDNGDLQFGVGGVVYTWPTDTTGPTDNFGLQIGSGGATQAATLAWANNSAVVAGSTTEIQFNNSGAFAGSAALTFTSGSGQLASTESVVGGGAADASAAVTVSSTAKGLLPPRMTATERGNVSSPTDGLFLYDTTDDAIFIRESSAWSRCITSSKDYMFAVTASGNQVGVAQFVVLWDDVRNSGIAYFAGDGHFILGANKVYMMTYSLYVNCTPDTPATFSWFTQAASTMHSHLANQTLTVAVNSSDASTFLTSHTVLFDTGGGQGTNIFIRGTGGDVTVNEGSITMREIG